MANSSSAPVTKIYQLQTTGYNELHSQLQQLLQDFAAIRKEKEALNRTASTIQDPAQLAVISRQLQDLAVKEGELSNKIKIRISDRRTEIEYERRYGETAGQTTAKVMGAFAKLNQAYKEAKQNAADLAAEFGADSQQAIAAAEVADVYYQKLVEINNAIKGRPKPVDTPVTTTAVQVPPDVVATTLAYDAYTGSIQTNLTALVENEAALAANKAEQKALSEAIAAAGAPTQEQTLKLVQLREEAAVLANQNKDLSTTIGNQIKEFNERPAALTKCRHS